MRIKLIHTADLHVGRLFGRTAAEEGSIRRRDILEALHTICQTVIQEGADFLLICGDLLEESAGEREREEVRNLLQSVAPAQVLWSLGQSDWNQADGDCPENVHRFPAGFHKMEFPEKHTIVWGESWESGTWSDGFAQFLPPAGEDTCQILMVYGDAEVENSERHPVDLGALRDMGVDYCALGGRHKMTLWGREGDIWAAYPGSPEPLDPQEEGEHGFLQVTVEKGSGYRIRGAERKYCARRHVRRHVISVTPNMGLEELCDQIRNAFRTPERQKELCVAVLQGTRRSFAAVDTDALCRRLAGEFLFLTAEDQTQPELDLNRLRDANAENLLGKYIAAMQERIRNAQNEKERETLQSALEAGAEALLNSTEQGR